MPITALPIPLFSQLSAHVHAPGFTPLKTRYTREWNHNKRVRHTQLFVILLMLIGPGGCASGGGGGNSTAQNRVLCGDNELTAKPCNSTIGQETPTSSPPFRSLVSTSLEVTPLPPSPSTTTGTYEAIALRRLEWKGNDTVRSFVQDSHTVRIRVDPGTRTYTIFVDLPDLRDVSAFTLEDRIFGSHVKYGSTFSDGRTEFSEDDVTSATLFQIDKIRSVPDVLGTERLAITTQVTGLAHVSLGQWLQRDVSWDPDRKQYNTEEFDCEKCPRSTDNEADLGRLLFAYGSRTSSGGMPLSGSATFQLQHLLSTDIQSSYDRSFGAAPGLVELTADFGRQSISARLEHPAQQVQDRDIPFRQRFLWGLDLRGDAPLTSDGRFGIPLTGNLLSIDPEVKEQHVPLAGRIEGAFFGPAAEEIGGVFLIEATNRSFVMEGAFTADRQ